MNADHRRALGKRARPFASCTQASCAVVQRAVSDCFQAHKCWKRVLRKMNIDCSAYLEQQQRGSAADQNPRDRRQAPSCCCPAAARRLRAARHRALRCAATLRASLRHVASCRCASWQRTQWHTSVTKWKVPIPRFLCELRIHKAEGGTAPGSRDKKLLAPSSQFKLQREVGSWTIRSAEAVRKSKID